MALRLSVVIPAYNAAATLGQCLDSLRASALVPYECVVVNDGSADDSLAIAEAANVRVLHTGGRRGPAYARNLGARQTDGGLLIFIDADVCVHADTLQRIAARFEHDPGLHALVGSYDDAPPEPGFFSQYRNLMHHYVHQQARGPVATFWTGCGAIRHQVFTAMQGLDERFRAASIEDIDLGYRMAAAGYRVELDPSVQVTHLKRWTFRDIVSTDVLRRGIPWVKLMLRSRSLPNHLNVSRSQRASVVLAWAAVLAALCLSPVAIAFLIGVLALNADFYRFLQQRRGVWFAIRAVPMHVLYHLYNGVSLGGGLWAHLWEPNPRRSGRRSGGAWS